MVESFTSCSLDRSWDHTRIAGPEDDEREESKRIFRRIDRRLVVVLGFLYAVALMDRSNTGIAMVEGMGIDLCMEGSRYSIVVLAFFIPYTLFQPLAMIVLRKVGPNVFFSTTTIALGMTTIVSGFVRSWAQLVPLRLLAGACEAGSFSGCAYLLSCWYPRYDLQKRNAAFYLIGITASALSGLLAYGISQMGGLGFGPNWWGSRISDANASKFTRHGPGLAPWRWIFIMEGIITCILATSAYILLVGFPERLLAPCGLKPLTKREAHIIVACIDRDRHDALPEEFQFRAYIKHAGDPYIWGYAALFGFTTISTYAMAYYLPLILHNSMGFGVAATLCLNLLPYVAAAITMSVVAYYSDKCRLRSPFILCNCCVLVLGLLLLGLVQNVAIRYFGAVLATTACNANVPCIMSWQANNIRGQWKRALCSSTLVGMDGIGGILGSVFFHDSARSLPQLGIYIATASSILMILITLWLGLELRRANGSTDAEERVIERLGGFRYTL